MKKQVDWDSLESVTSYVGQLVEDEGQAYCVIENPSHHKYRYGVVSDLYLQLCEDEFNKVTTIRPGYKSKFQINVEKSLEETKSKIDACETHYAHHGDKEALHHQRDLKRHKDFLEFTIDRLKDQ